MTSIPPTQSPRTSVLSSTPTIASRRRAQRTLRPAIEPREVSQSEPGCFAKAFNSVFEQVMTKLFGRDGRG